MIRFLAYALSVVFYQCQVRSHVTESDEVGGVTFFNKIMGVNWLTPKLDRESVQARRNGSEEFSVANIIDAAQHRGHVRSAVLAYAGGGAEGLFKAYEALTYELLDARLLDYAGGVGTREWLIQQGWVTEPEEARFLDTVLHYGRQNSAPSVTPASPIEAQRVVGKLLTKWIEHISPE